VKPFTRGRFADLPEKPRRPHHYNQSRGAEIHLRSEPFGPIDVHYRELGSGPPLLLVHGLMTSSYSWRYIMDALGGNPRAWAHRNVHYFDESLKSLEEAAEYGDPLATEEGAGAFIRYLWHTFDPKELRQFMRALAEKPFPVPLLLVYSRQDPLVPPVIGERLQRATAAPLLWLDDTSHFAHVDTPEKVLEAMRDFLDPEKGKLSGRRADPT
jgi:pimeloyl-ACP methyl ester carboxylesterase